MPPITPNDRRAQLLRDHALQIDALRKQAHDGGCHAVSIRLEHAGDDCVVRFSLFHRDDHNAFRRIKRLSACFREAFANAGAALPAAIRSVCADAAFRAECAGDDDADAQRERRERIAEERWEARRNEEVA